MEPLVSVIIPTYKRALFLRYVLDGLKRQSYHNFEVVVVFKPSGDNTKQVLRSYKKHLLMKIIEQRNGSVTDAYNMGLNAAKGKIIAFLDDDAVPFSDWLEEHMKIYESYNEVGGVSGPALAARIANDGSVTPISEDSVYPYGRQIKHYDFPWARPLTGMSDWLIFFGRDGMVHHHPRFLKRNVEGVFSSLLFMGANMSVKKKAIEGLKVWDQLLLGFCFEQLLSYEIWRRDYKIVFSSSAKVLHIIHEESLGRFFKHPMRSSLRDAELVLTFFALKFQNGEVSIYAHILELLKLIVGRIYRGREYGFDISMHRIFGLLYGFVIGCAYIISRALKSDFSIKNSLTKVFNKDSPKDKGGEQNVQDQ